MTCERFGWKFRKREKLSGCDSCYFVICSLPYAATAKSLVILAVKISIFEKVPEQKIDIMMQ